MLTDLIKGFDKYETRDKDHACSMRILPKFGCLFDEVINIYDRIMHNDDMIHPKCCVIGCCVDVALSLAMKVAAGITFGWSSKE